MGQQMLSTSIGSVDRPDVIKQESKTALSFKEVKDCLFKFLMQAGIPFTDSEKMSLVSEVKSKFSDEVVTLTNGSYYSSTCKLNNIKVGGKPVYLLVIPQAFIDLENRQKNKILALKKTYNIITFDALDWKGIGLDLSSEKQWLRPLTKVMLKNLAKKLFEKLSKVGDKIESQFTLNDLYHTIELNTATRDNKESVLENLTKENFELKKRLREYQMAEVLDIRDSHHLILDELSTINKLSSDWIGATINLILQDIFSNIDLRQNLYKDLFRLKNGKILISNKDKLCEFVTRELTRKRPILDTTYLGNGLIEIKNKKTLQILTVYLQPTKSTKLSPLQFSSSTVKKINTRLVFTLFLYFSDSTSKINRTIGDVILLDYYSDLFKYEKEKRLPIYDSKFFKEYTLWTMD